MPITLQCIYVTVKTPTEDFLGASKGIKIGITYMS